MSVDGNSTRVAPATWCVQAKTHLVSTVPDLAADLQQNHKQEVVGSNKIFKGAAVNILGFNEFTYHLQAHVFHVQSGLHRKCVTPSL